VGGVAHSGRVVFAAAGVMVAVFLTFALSGPLPPKEMGVILGIAVLLDAALVRLLLVPVALRLLGRWACWLPKPLGRRRGRDGAPAAPRPLRPRLGDTMHRTPEHAIEPARRVNGGIVRWTATSGAGRIHR
ncbi:MAG TPA: MMPL family transporter, partial [Solirubrobacteraceae bacterium]|nr:MMPL family transporter [Solirubrobacteraceae bacterium]